MTDICFDVAPLPFAAAAQQPQQLNGNQRQYDAAPPRCAVHGNETFVARGTSAADLAALFGHEPR